MKPLIAVAMFLMCTSVAVASSFSNLSLTSKLALTEKCNESTCNANSKIKVRLDLTTNLPPGTAASFNGTTEFSFNATFMNPTFQLGEDPAYVPGATSIVIDDDMAGIKRKVKMDWAGDILVLSYSLTGKGTENTPHATVAELHQATKGDKSHYNGIPFEVAAHNGAVELFKYGAVLFADFKSSQMEQGKAIGTTTVKTDLRIRSKGWF